MTHRENMSQTAINFNSPRSLHRRREAAAIFGMKQSRSKSRPFADLIQETIKWSRYSNEWKRLKDVFYRNENTQSFHDFIGKYDNLTSAFADHFGWGIVFGNTMFTPNADFMISVDANFRITDLSIRINLRNEDIRDWSNLPPNLQVS